VVIDGNGVSAPHDLDGDGFAETMAISHADAYALLTDGNAAFVNSVKSNLGRWQMPPEDIGDFRNRAVVPTPTPDHPLSTGGAASASSGSDPEAAAGGTHHGGATVEPVAQPGVAPAATGTPVPSERAEGLRFTVGHTIREFSNEEVSFFPGNTALNQLNVGIVGDLGTGKTQLIQSLIYQLRANASLNRGKPPNILIFDYKKDYSKPAFVEATGARVIEPFEMPLNLFDTRDLLQSRNAWLERAKFFSDVLDKIYSGIGPAQRQRIKTAIQKSYGDHAGQAGPTIHDVFEAYRQSQSSVDSPYSIMSDLVDGGYFVADSSAVVPFSEFLDGVVVLDLAAVGQDDRTKNMLVVIFLNLFYEHMLRIEKRPFIGRDPSCRFVDTMLLVDEADNIMQYEFDVLKKILLQGREFGVGVLLASQYLSHFKTAHENYVEPLLTWFIHKVPHLGVKDLEGIGLTGVGQDLVDSVKALACHECLYKTLGVEGRIIRAKPFFELRPGP
jgi:DNA phosphorothioation-dependent restriction protein DptH